MIDVAIEGRLGEPFPFHLEAGKVREFMRALGWEGPVPEVIPPTFLTTMFFWEREVIGADLWPGVGMDPSRGKHAEQSYEFFGAPPRVGDRLVARSSIGKVTRKQGRRGGELTFVELDTEFRDEAGRLVARAKMTAVETSPEAG